MMSPLNLNGLSAEEKFKARFDAWMSTDDKPFAGPEAAAAYTRRATRYYDVIRLHQPDRVPVVLNVGGYPAQYTGTPHRDFFYDFEKAAAAMARFYKDFDLEYQVADNFYPGRALERVGYKLFRWPGAGLAAHRPFQCDEREYMTADEYDRLIADPGAFMLNTFAPRVFDALGGLGMLPNFIGATELLSTAFTLLPLGAPPVVAAFEALAEAGRETQAWMGAKAGVGMRAQSEKGVPATVGGFTKAPFDFIGDTLRGTHGIMLDMYRNRDKIIDACNRLVPIAIHLGVNAADQSGVPVVVFPLHKGADGFMSPENFERLYWPSLKAVILGIIEAGVVPLLFVEGAYNRRRLEIIADSGLPAGKTIWYFDRTDMAQAKAKIGGWACISGNVPASLFKTGTPEQMTDAVKRLMDIAAPGGGYFIANGAILDDAEAPNVHAYLHAAKTHGGY